VSKGNRRLGCWRLRRPQSWLPQHGAQNGRCADKAGAAPFSSALGAKKENMETHSKTSGLKKKRKIFGWVFLVSILVFFASNMIWTMAPMSPPEMNAPIGAILRDSTAPPSHVPNSAALDTAVVVSVVSLLTSLTSLVGFLSTTVLAWRKERREAVSAELEIKKKELELEKLKIELAKSEGSGKNESTKQSKFTRTPKSAAPSSLCLLPPVICSVRQHFA
jgi:hypothetical protein